MFFHSLQPTHVKKVSLVLQFRFLLPNFDKLYQALGIYNNFSWSYLFYYPPSPEISSCVRTVDTMMCLQTWPSPAMLVLSYYNELFWIKIAQALYDIGLLGLGQSSFVSCAPF